MTPVPGFYLLFQVTDVTLKGLAFFRREKNGSLFLKSFVFCPQGDEFPALDFMCFLKRQGGSPYWRDDFLMRPSSFFSAET